MQADDNPTPSTTVDHHRPLRFVGWRRAEAHPRVARGVGWCALAVMFAGCGDADRPPVSGNNNMGMASGGDAMLSDAEASVSGDVGPDTADAGMDATMDVAPDVTPEAAVDVMDVREEAPVDAAMEAAMDVAPDSRCPARQTLCGDTCVDTSSDMSNCGSCGTACMAPAHAMPTCMSGACRFTCESGYGDCDSDATNGCETDLNTTTDHCGTCDTRCASMRCVMGACAILPSRLIGPLSGTIVSRAPVLRWQSAAGTDGARVDLCPTDSCTGRITSFTAGASSGTPPMPLAPGRYFWRVIGRNGMREGTAASEVWSFSVGRSSGSADAVGTGVYDGNRDGIPEVVVGANEVGVTTVGRRNAGRAHVFTWSSDGPESDPTSTVGPAGEYGNYGAAVASAGDVNGDGYSDLLISAPLASMRAGDGLVYLTPGGALGTLGAMATTLNSVTARSAFGASFDSAGDVNGDGYGDVIIGAPGVAPPYGTPTAQGYAHLFLGSAMGLASTPAMTLTNGDTERGAFGTAVTAGDLNGDGRQDLVVSASLTGDWDGAVYIYLQPTMGFTFTAPPMPSAVLRGTSTLRAGGGATGQGEQFGARVVVGNFNSDRFADLAIAAPGGDNTAGVYGAGRVYIFLGRDDWSSRTASATVYGPAVTGSRFGAALCGNGDLNADGYTDLAVGAPGDLRDQGRVYVYRGSASGIADRAVPAWILASPGGPGGAFGFALGAGADLNRDNIADLVVGAPGLSTGGKVYAYYGTTDGLLPTPSVNVDNPTNITGSAFGQAIW